MKPQPPSPEGVTPKLRSCGLLWLAIFVSVFSFLFYYRHGDVLLYGDAVAHINIARRVFDSKTPGLLQLGTVWLPLPHLLILPFIVSQRNVAKRLRRLDSVDGRVCIRRAGNIPSGARIALARRWASRMTSRRLGRVACSDSVCRESKSDLHAVDRHGRVAVSGVFYLGRRLLRRICSREMQRRSPSAACAWRRPALTRYDGWFLAAVLVVAAQSSSIFTSSQASPKRKSAPRSSSLPSRGHIIKFVLIAAAAPILWLAYNASSTAILWSSPTDLTPRNRSSRKPPR